MENKIKNQNRLNQNDLDKIIEIADLVASINQKKVKIKKLKQDIKHLHKKIEASENKKELAIIEAEIEDII